MIGLKEGDDIGIGKDRCINQGIGIKNDLGIKNTLVSGKT